MNGGKSNLNSASTITGSGGRGNKCSGTSSVWGSGWKFSGVVICDGCNSGGDVDNVIWEELS